MGHEKRRHDPSRPPEVFFDLISKHRTADNTLLDISGPICGQSGAHVGALDKRREAMARNAYRCQSLHITQTTEAAAADGPLSTSRTQRDDTALSLGLNGAGHRSRVG